VESFEDRLRGEPVVVGAEHVDEVGEQSFAGAGVLGVVDAAHSTRQA
jgi:hypothetical protein